MGSLQFQSRSKSRFPVVLTDENLFEVGEKIESKGDVKHLEKIYAELLSGNEVAEVADNFEDFVEAVNTFKAINGVTLLDALKYFVARYCEVNSENASSSKRWAKALRTPNSVTNPERKAYRKGRAVPDFKQLEKLTITKEVSEEAHGDDDLKNSGDGGAGDDEVRDNAKVDGAGEEVVEDSGEEFWLNDNCQ